MMQTAVADGARAQQVPDRLGYRADIDGLRAIAVLPVLFFHAGVRGFSGGFVGVDIFFVISGYLITGILLRDAEQGRVSIADFYRRRVLRIFPALGAMLLATTVAAVFLLLPSEVPTYATSLAGTAIFVSNIGFYASTDYFNAGAEAQPLLHCWSLAVEEQWYLLWPLLIALLARKRKLLLILTITITVSSLAASILWLPRDPPAAFYLLPFRAWELGAGALVAMHRLPARKPVVASLLGVAGLALIAFAVKGYTDQTPFPGIAAVPPCLGALLLIAAGRSPNMVSAILALPPLRFIGLISYSLYLWHWPIIVFADTGLLLGHSVVATIAIVAASLFAAFLSWRCIEQPIRSAAAHWRTHSVLRWGGAGILAALGLAILAPILADRIDPLTPRQRAIANYLGYDGDGAYRRGTCFKVGWRASYDRAGCLASTGKPALLLVGDSHAAQLWPGLSRWRSQVDILQATATECVAKRYPGHASDACGQVVDYALHDWLRTHRPARLILAAKWERRWLDGLEDTLRDPLIRASHPILVGPIPQYLTGVPRLVVAAERRHDPDLPRRALLEEPFATDIVLRAIAARTGTPYISLVDLLCNARRQCRTMASPDVPLQFDYGHLTPAGSAVVTDALRPVLLAGLSAERPVSGAPHRAAATVDRAAPPK